jgi:hypothetical protein
LQDATDIILEVLQLLNNLRLWDDKKEEKNIQQISFPLSVKTGGSTCGLYEGEPEEDNNKKTKEEKGGDIMKKVLRLLRQFIPSLHYTTYICEGKKYFSIWKSWSSKCYNVVTIEV